MLRYLKSNVEKKNLIVAPVFDKTWINDQINKVADIAYYEEEDLINHSRVLRLLQAAAYFFDCLVPRRFSISQLVRLIRVNKIKSEELYSCLDKIGDSYEKIMLIKGFGSEARYFIKCSNKTHLILWDSTARYPVHKSMRKYLRGTTSPYDARRLSIDLISFFDLSMTRESVLRIEKKTVFVGRFSVFRLIKGVWIVINTPSTFMYFGRGPINLNIKGICISRDLISVSLEGSNELIVSDLNEDSPSFRLGECRARPIITDISGSTRLISSNVYLLKYFPLRLEKYRGNDQLQLKYFKDMLL